MNKKRVLVPIPMLIMKSIVGVGEKIPFFPLNSEQLSLFETDNILKNKESDSDLVRRLEIAEEYRRRRVEMDASLDVNATPPHTARRPKRNFDAENLENETFHQGMLLYAVNALYASVQKHKRMFSPKEYRGVKLDAMALADVGVSIEGKLLTTARLARIYKGFQSEPHRVPSIVTGRYPV